MTYHKIEVDNVICSRRFHITFDDSQPKQASVELNCPYCGITVFNATNHPAAQLARQENLVRTAELSDLIIDQCHFKDRYSEKTQIKK